MATVKLILDTKKLGKTEHFQLNLQSPISLKHHIYLQIYQFLRHIGIMVE